MGKLIVPQEHQEKIIRAYVEQGKGVKTIKRELKLPYSPQKIKEVLQDNDIHIRGVSETNALKRKYEINDGYEFNSHNGAWILGLLASDGYLPKTTGAQNRVVLTLQRQDEDTLELIKDELQYTGPIYQYESTNGYPNSSLAFTSRLLRDRIEGYGITNAKTFTLKGIPENLPRDFYLDFIRGYFDGDGSVYAREDEKKVGMSFTSATKQILIDIATFLAEEYGVAMPTIRKVERTHVIYDMRYYKRDSLTLGDLFYDNDYLSLIRKKKHFFELKQKFPMVR